MKNFFALAFITLMGTPWARLAAGSAHPPKIIPELRLSCDPSAFSPNNDRVKDQVFLQPALSAPGQIRKWALMIKSHSGKTVKKMNGYDDLPALFVWGGEDQKGHMVKEGSYTVRLTVWGREWGSVSASCDATLDLSPPVMGLEVSTPSFSAGVEGEEGHIAFQGRAEDPSGIDHWELTLRREGGAPVKTWRSTGTVPGSLVWDGREERFGVIVPTGRYLAVLFAWDAAGNTGQSAEVGFSVDSKTPKVLGAGLKNIDVQEFAGVLVVKLPESNIFTRDGQEPALIKPQAWDFLNELSYLAQAYPDRPCVIEGFSHGFPSESQDEKSSSAWAWKIYSVLVKSGVNPKRLEVHGRGRQTPPLLKLDQFDGVIVTLAKAQEEKK